ncbi:hypothetical protein OMDBNIEC_00049 [Salmonella phage STP-SP5]|nr:hypothetical protein OMDBNIEC_00049 [Salmonella phage STP-SP5]
MNWSEVFDYRDGELYWRKPLSARIKIGSKAGCIDAAGYVKTRYNNQQLHAHRIIWEMFKGPIPEGLMIDHIDRNRSNNRIENLRLVSRSGNAKNQKLPSTNTSGVIGVSFRKCDGKWIAHITNNGKFINLGIFINKEDAIKARRDAEIKYAFHPNHGK